MNLLRKGTAISTLRVRSSPHADALALRRHVERDLASQSLVPPGMTEEGILCIRHFSDAAPGLLGAAQPGLRQLSTWDQATREALSNCLRTALRPERGYVPPDAASVYFPNEADLIACLALSKTRRTFPQEWWWKELLGASRLTLPWTVFWIEAPTSIVSAVSRLADGRQLHEVLAATSPSELETLHRVVTHCHVVSPTLATLAPWRGTLSPFSEYVTVRPSPAVASTAGNDELEQELARQIASDLPELSLFDPDSPPFQFALTSLLVKRNPSAARRVTAKTLRFLSELRTVRPESPAAEPAPAQGHASSTSATPATPAEAAPNSSAHRKCAPPGAPVASNALESAQSSATMPRNHTAPSFVASMPQARSTRQGKTAHGGVFYLLNLALHFGLYSDFTQPRGFNLALSPWDFLSEIARRLFAETPPPDPLWEFLAVLSGNPTAEKRQELWLPPSGWKPALPEMITTALHANEARVDAWLDQLATTFASRVLTASGLHPSSWLHAEATYRLTDDRLDVHYVLADHPVELRFAGLDRNPGWIPAANVSVSFHYE